MATPWDRRVTTVVLGIFFFMNIIQVATVLFGLAFVLHAIWRDHDRAAVARLVRPIGNGDPRQRSVALYGRNVSRTQVLECRQQLTPISVGEELTKPGLEALKHDRKMLKESSGGSAAENDAVRNFSPPPLSPTQYHPMVERSLDETGPNTRALQQWGQDPLIYLAAASSKFAEKYTPLHAKAAWTTDQMNGRLVMPHPITSGTAFVVPSGHVFNKCVGMTAEDLDAHSPPEPDPIVDLQPSCASAPAITRTNLFGYGGGATQNVAALTQNTTETLLCPCKIHAPRLQSPDPATFSPDPTVIEIDISQKCALLPGAGLDPVASTQLTVRSKMDGVAPAYGAGLINLPVQDLPLAINCLCTDRANGAYSVSRPGEETHDEKGIRYDQLANFLNANPTTAAVLHSHLGGATGSSWVMDGGPIKQVVCMDETIVALN